MPTDILNVTGSRLSRFADDRALQQVRQGLVPPDQAAADSGFVNDAIQQAESGDLQAALASAENIRDEQTRLRTFFFLREKRGVDSAFITSGEAFTDNTIGVADPNILFFMMVFYLNQRSPRINWNDILKSVSGSTGTEFRSLRKAGQTSDPFPLPPSRTIQILAGLTETRRNKELEKQRGNRGEEAEFADETEQAQQELDKATREASEELAALNRSAEQAGKRSVQALNSNSAAATALWPIQNMPIIEGGWTKSVDWSSAKQVITFAEPILTNDGGASAIELDIQFTYAVGVPGLGPNTAPWTTEQVLGIIYLASSLVYPFESHRLISARAASEDDQPPSDSEKVQSQFPILFLRHYSLFPFLTPFVVKQVTIQPDENQPLLITEPVNIREVNTHLSLPAVRQIVNITLSLMSAHFYLPALSEGVDENNIQLQTSGKTYLSIANQLLGDKFRG